MSLSSFLPPIIVRLGRRKRKALRSLDRHAGPLAEEVDEAVEQVRKQLGAEAEGRTLVPVVVVYRKKQKKQNVGLADLLL